MAFAGVTWDFQQTVPAVLRVRVFTDLKPIFTATHNDLGSSYILHTQTIASCFTFFVTESVNHICLEWMQYALTVCLRSLRNA
jgi:hypothetical protein